MSGSKRRSGYRKTVEDDVLHGLPELGTNDSVAVISKGAGSNLFEVSFSDGSRTLAMLPSKFRKLVWLKRGDYIIVSGAEGSTQTARGTAGAVTHAIEHILYTDAIKHLRAKGQWPAGLERERESIVSSVPAGSEEAPAPMGSYDGGGDSIDGDDPALNEQPGARRLQGMRGLPPQDDDEEDDEEEAHAAATEAAPM